MKTFTKIVYIEFKFSKIITLIFIGPFKAFDLVALCPVIAFCYTFYLSILLSFFCLCKF